MLATGGAVIALVPDVWDFGAGLLLVGLGWSFGFIVRTAAGHWFDVNGVVGLGVLAVLVVALPFVAMLAFREGRPGEYRQAVK